MNISSGIGRATWYLLLLAFILGAIIFSIFFGNEKAPLSVEQYSNKTLPPQLLEHQREHTAHAGSESESDTELAVINFAYCSQYLVDTQLNRFNWGKENYSQWDRYLSQGYSLDDVTLAIDYFIGSNFAVRFRVSQLRKNTDLSHLNQQLNNDLPNQLSDAGFFVNITFPTRSLVKFSEMSTKEKANVLANEQLTADDVAYAMVQPEISDDDILQLLSKVQNPSAVVNYDRLEAISLLDYAVATTRPKVVEELINRGVSPTSDNYLGSTMEWALIGLRPCCEDRDAAIDIIRMLEPLQASARFEVKNKNRIEGSFPRRFYGFKESDIRTFYQDFGVDLTRIPSRQVPRVDPNHPLIQELEAQRSEYLNEPDRETCDRLVKTVNEQWQPQKTSKLLSSIEALYPDSPDRITTELAKIDPTLVDIYRSDGFSLERVDIPEEVEAQLMDGDIERATEYFASQTLTDGGRRWLVRKILLLDMSYYRELRRSHLLSEEIQYSELQLLGLSKESVSKLEIAGADLRGADKRQKTLLFYAVKSADLELVTFLEKQGYPFSRDHKGQDPLHLALNIRPSPLSVQKAEKLIPILMRYNPVIDNFHLSRMAVIKLRYPQLYQGLISSYPELTIQADTELPQVL